MALKILRNQSPKKRSLPFLGSHKTRPERSSSQHSSASSLIDRRPISPELESEIRYACALLCYSIERGIPLRYPQDELGARDEQPDETNAAPNTTDYSPPGIPEKDRQGMYDSGIGLEIQVPNNQASSARTSRFYEQYNRQTLKDWVLVTPMAQPNTVRLVDAESESEGTSHSTELDSGAISVARPHMHPDWDTSSDEVSLNPKAASMLHRAPCFTWARSGRRLDRSKHTENTRIVASRLLEKFVRFR